MLLNIKQSIIFSLLLLFSLNVHANHNTLIKGRAGYLNPKKSNDTGSNGNASHQKVTEGIITEIALTKFCHPIY